MLEAKGIVRAGYGNKKAKQGQGIVRIWTWFKNEFLMPLYPLTNFEKQRYYLNEPNFNDVY